MSSYVTTQAQGLPEPKGRDMASALGPAPRVLIAEDDPELRTILEDVFRDDGWIVSSASNGTKLLDELSQAIIEENGGVPDLVLTDIMMPGIQVLAMLGELRAAGWMTPVIVVSARADELANENAGTFDPICFCQKPVDLDRLLDLAHVQRRKRSGQVPFYRGSQSWTVTKPREVPRVEGSTSEPRPSEDLLEPVDNKTEAPPSTESDLEPKRRSFTPLARARTLYTLLRRRPILHLAEQDPDALDAYADFFENNGWHVRSSRSGSDFLIALARDLLRYDPPDVLLLDERLPGFDGAAVCRGLADADVEVPIVVITDPSTAARRGHIGASAIKIYVERPVNTQSLEGTVYEAIVDSITNPRRTSLPIRRP